MAIVKDNEVNLVGMSRDSIDQFLSAMRNTKDENGESVDVLNTAFLEDSNGDTIPVSIKFHHSIKAWTIIEYFEGMNFAPSPLTYIDEHNIEQFSIPDDEVSSLIVKKKLTVKRS